LKASSCSCGHCYKFTQAVNFLFSKWEIKTKDQFQEIKTYATHSEHVVAYVFSRQKPRETNFDGNETSDRHLIVNSGQKPARNWELNLWGEYFHLRNWLMKWWRAVITGRKMVARFFVFELMLERKLGLH
jgi:hypothetical protein